MRVRIDGLGVKQGLLSGMGIPLLPMLHESI